MTKELLLRNYDLKMDHDFFRITKVIFFLFNNVNKRKIGENFTLWNFLGSFLY